jgi:uncharacterized membrane protein YdjX (TVP38/TMEM64 family)
MRRVHTPRLKNLAKARLHICLFCFFGLGVLFALALAHSSVNPNLALQNLLLWLRGLGSVGILAFIVIYNLATLFLVPASLLTVGGGAIYGLWWGSAYVLVAALMGAVIAFMIGRYGARSLLLRILQKHPHLQRLDAALGQKGLQIVLLTRLSPLLPFNLMNYLFGVSRIPLKDYVIGSVGILPGTIMYVYIGAVAADLTILDMNQSLDPQLALTQLVIKCMGLFATVITTVYLTSIAQQALAKQVDPDTDIP